ncbi:MAG: hypothetical protein MJY98_04215 [Fibrobacter sp.]|nr:hypothetical protein [Fibrobacter sp.]
MTLRKIGFAITTVATAFGLMACGDDSSTSSAPETPAVSSSSEEQTLSSSSSFNPENFDLEEFEKNLPEDCNTLEDSALIILCNLHKLGSELPNFDELNNHLQDSLNIEYDPNNNPFAKCDEIEDIQEQLKCQDEVADSISQVIPAVPPILLPIDPSLITE